VAPNLVLRLFVYRLAPHSGWPRVILIRDEIFTKAGGYVLGNFLTSVIAGIGAYVWLIIFGVPHPVIVGMVGALVVIPAAAAVRLFLQEVAFRRLDTS
jgi:predicted PurR-regulated permease PerM